MFLLADALFGDVFFGAAVSGEIMLDFTPDKIYEYACHECNYGMYNILSGHRAEERMAREAAEQ